MRSKLLLSGLMITALVMGVGCSKDATATQPKKVTPTKEDFQSYLDTAHDVLDRLNVNVTLASSQILTSEISPLSYSDKTIGEYISNERNDYTFIESSSKPAINDSNYFHLNLQIITEINNVISKMTDAQDAIDSTVPEVKQHAYDALQSEVKKINSLQEEVTVTKNNLGTK